MPPLCFPPDRLAGCPQEDEAGNVTEEYWVRGPPRANPGLPYIVEMIGVTVSPGRPMAQGGGCGCACVCACVHRVHGVDLGRSIGDGIFFFLLSTAP